MTKAEQHLTVSLHAQDIDLADLDNVAWLRAPEVRIARYWSGEAAPEGRHFSARAIGSRTALYVRFEANQAEPLVVSAEPVLDKKSVGLWERDVCEVFLAPDRDQPKQYFEFEVAPTGEWLDVAIDLTSGDRVPDWDFHSGMQASARIDDGRVLISIRIPWEAFGKRPGPGDIWLGNIFRCVGRDPGRGYLAWQPTLTEKPNFHVPKAFGEFRFIG